MESTNWDRNRAHSTKTAVEHWTYDDGIECPNTLTIDTVIKHESKIKCMLKEEVKDERKAMCTKYLKANKKHLHLDKVMVLEKRSDSFKIEKSVSDS